MTVLMRTPGDLSLTDWATVRDQPHCALQFPDSAWQAVAASAAQLQQAAASHDVVYGVNTGFGKLASQRIATGDLAQLQLNLLRSHAVGVGAPLDAGVVRLILASKAASLARGYSGVRAEIIQRLLDFLRLDVLPVVPCQGSVGASGDLAPLSHLCLPIIGEGEVFYQGQRMSAQAALTQCGLAPITLQAKEGLALINGTQVSTALALAALIDAQRLFDAALCSGALTLEAARGSDAPFDPRIHSVRGQEGQMRCAAVLRALLQGSAVRESHREGDDRVQDPYCLRCQPQVMGACLDQLKHAARILGIEANGVTDNPLVLPADAALGLPAALVSGGNFHAEPVALAADNLALVLAEIGALAERRIAMLIDSSISRLPAFLTPEPGLNSGFMIAHVTAAALASENKSLAHPASVDSLPTSANQEDHVSMATFAARRLHSMLANTAQIVAIELLAAAQGLEFLRPLQTSSSLEAVFAVVRSHSAKVVADRSLAADMQALQQALLQGQHPALQVLLTRDA